MLRNIQYEQRELRNNIITKDLPAYTPNNEELQ